MVIGGGREEGSGSGKNRVGYRLLTLARGREHGTGRGGLVRKEVIRSLGCVFLEGKIKREGQLAEIGI